MIDVAEHVAVTPGTPAEQTKQSPVLAFRADAQRSAKQPAQSRMTSLTTPLTTRDVASQGPASAPRSPRIATSTSVIAKRSIAARLPESPTYTSRYTRAGRELLAIATVRMEYRSCAWRQPIDISLSVAPTPSDPPPAAPSRAPLRLDHDAWYRRSYVTGMHGTIVDLRPYETLLMIRIRRIRWVESVMWEIL